jgi:hypothetical protein
MQPLTAARAANGQAATPQASVRNSLRLTQHLVDGDVGTVSAIAHTGEAIVASQQVRVAQDRCGSKSTVAVSAYGSKTSKADQGSLNLKDKLDAVAQEVRK